MGASGSSERTDTMKPAWILVANAAQARLVEQEPGSPMVVVHAFHHPESRLSSSMIGDSERGRQSSDRAYGAQAYAAHLEPHRKEHLRFAGEVADYLEQAALQGRMHKLHVFAASPFLGELKARFGDATLRLLAGTHDLDLSSFGLDEIERRVQLALHSAA